MEVDTPADALNNSKANESEAKDASKNEDLYVKLKELQKLSAFLDIQG